MKTKTTNTKSITRPLLLCLVLLATLACSATAHAENSLSLRISSSYFSSQGFDAVSENDNLVQAEFNYARKLFSLWRGHLWAEGSYLIGAKRSELFGETFKTSLTVQQITVGARYTLPVFEWLVPQVRTGLGLLVGIFNLDPSSDDYSQVSDTAFGLNGYLLGGVELLLPRSLISTRVTVGLTLEAGITFSTGLGFALEPEEDDELQQIPLIASELGSIPLSGPQFRIGAVVRF